jgi:hypothetical protein
LIWWKGYRVKTLTRPLGRTFRAALILVSCDIPATRKVGVCT